MRQLLIRELLLIYRNHSGILRSLIFYMLVMVLFPLTMSYDPALLAQIAPGIIWLAVLFAVIQAIPLLFAGDKMDGTLDQLMLASIPLTMIILVKVCAHWLLISMPLILLTSVFTILFNIEIKVEAWLLLSILLGTPILHLMGTFVAALVLDNQQANLLLALILIPLFMPSLIFATGMVESVQQGNSVLVPCLLLLALLVLSLTTLPFLTSQALKISVNYA